VLLTDFDFALPDELIARFPAIPRDRSRLLCLSKTTGKREHGEFRSLLEKLHPGDLLVFNDTKVIPARLQARTENEGAVEILLLEPAPEGSWRCLVKPGKKVKAGLTVKFSDGSRGTLTRHGDDFFLRAEGLASADEEGWLDRNGAMPLPPYLNREATAEDKATYQTVYARVAGSIAAPTAGLHFTPELLAELEKKGVEFAFLTLKVGYGTFAPVKTDLSEHQMHAESYEIPTQTLEKITECRKRGGRVISVGTTSLRALESFSLHGASGNTRIFITPGHQFQLADGLITNFHLPQSTLLILVSAFAGRDNVLAAYREAVERRYRFFSYGDAMLIL